MPNTQNIFIHTVLVRPIYPKNIGQAARATANCGFGNLHIIAPQCELDSEMRKGAAGSQNTLEEATVYSSWEEFNDKNKDCFRIGLTRRVGKQRKPIPFEKGIESYYEQTSKPLYLVFGPEDDGLATDDLDHTHMSCSFSLYGDFKSLNLAHAVLLAQHKAHEIVLNKAIGKDLQTESEKEHAQTEEIFPDLILQKWLKASGVQKSPERNQAFHSIRKMILRGFPSPKELSTFEKALYQSLHRSERNDSD